MPYSWLFPFLTQNFPWAPHSSGLRVPSLPSRCWMLSLLQKQEALSGSHLPASHTFPPSPSPRVPEQGTDQLWPRHKTHLSCGAWALGLLASSSKPSSLRNEKNSISRLKKPQNYKEILDRSMLSLIKEITLGGPHATSWVGVWVGLVGVFCLHIQIYLVEEYLVEYFYFTPSCFTFHLFISRHKGWKVLVFHFYTDIQNVF